MRLQILAGHFSVVQLPPGSAVPEWARGEELWALVRTPQEVSVVCEEAGVPQGIRAERGWRALRVEGPLDFSLVGVLSAIASPLAQAGVSLFAISTFATDYILVKGSTLFQAVEALRNAGHIVEGI